MSQQAITIDTRPDGVAVLTFDQPGSKANVLTRELWAEFGEALAGLATRTDIKGLVLTSAKPGIFIAGADLKLLANAPAPNDPDVRAFIEQGLRVLEQLEALPFPTCAAIDGAALGGGFEVALACDYRVCGSNPKAHIGLPEVTLGLIPGWGGTQRLPRLPSLDALPERRFAIAADLLVSGKGVGAQEAASLCLIDGITGSERLIDFAADTLLLPANPQRDKVHQARRAARLDSLPAAQLIGFLPPTATTFATSEAARVLVAGADLALYDAIKLETEAFMWLAGSDASKKRIADFFASRKK